MQDQEPLTVRPKRLPTPKPTFKPYGVPRYRAVVVMACDDEIVPLQERIETIGDEADLQEVYDTERYLLYVACTRARDFLLVTSIEPASEFLDDLKL
jgi:superfamily I DNA/RNA helicase